MFESEARFYDYVHISLQPVKMLHMGRVANLNGKVPSSNPTRHSARLRDPTSL